LGEHKNLDYPHLFLQAGDQLFRSELFDKALSFFEPLTELPEYSDSTLLVKIGRCLLRTQKQAHAEQTFQDAIELDDNNIEARMELAKILEAKNELHKALNLVNEVMLLRRGRYKGHADDDDDYDDGDEDHSREEGKEKVKRAPRPRVPREPKEPGVEKQVKANKRLMILSKGEELINHYQVFRSEQEGMKSGNSVATTAWLEAAKALTDDFRSCKAFYPWDKYIKFMGYSGDSVLHAATPLDADLTAIADRLSKSKSLVIY
jgi:general transcription factor 3C polypeptide 3 (transcription factor C subunit 4)